MIVVGSASCTEPARASTSARILQLAVLKASRVATNRAIVADLRVIIRQRFLAYSASLGLEICQGQQLHCPSAEGDPSWQGSARLDVPTEPSSLHSVASPWSPACQPY